MTNYIQCAVDRCGLPTAQGSRYCSRHQNRLRRLGNPSFVPLALPQVKATEKRVAKLLSMYRDTDAFKHACRAASTLLSYRAESQFRCHTDVEKEMTWLRGQGVRPEEVVYRICSVIITDYEQGIFPDEKSKRYALARHVLRLAKRPKQLGHRYGAVMLRVLGDMIQDTVLPLFALQFHKRVQEYEERLRVEREAMFTGWATKPDGSEPSLLEYLKAKSQKRVNGYSTCRPQRARLLARERAERERQKEAAANRPSLDEIVRAAEAELRE